MKEKNKKRKQCRHSFVYSHIECSPAGVYTAMPPDREVVICQNCGMIIKTNKI